MISGRNNLASFMCDMYQLTNTIRQVVLVFTVNPMVNIRIIWVMDGTLALRWFSIKSLTRGTLVCDDGVGDSLIVPLIALISSSRCEVGVVRAVKN